MTRVVFMGTAELACPALQALVCAPAFEVIAVVTQPDRKQGRKHRVIPSPVKRVATKCGVDVWQPEKIRETVFIERLKALDPDLIVVAAYGQILPKTILEIPSWGCINVHASLLPKYRGAAPIQWAILEGEVITGVTIMKMDSGLDTGEILNQQELPINAEDDAASLHERLSQSGAELLGETLPRYLSGAIVPRPQPSEGSSVARKITKADGKIRWKSAAEQIQNCLRALIPWPGVYTWRREEAGKTLLKIWRAEALANETGDPGRVLRVEPEAVVVGCGQGALRIIRLQREGGKPMDVHEFLTGHRIEVGEQWGD